MKFTNWGLIDYNEAWQKQKLVFDKILALKLQKEDTSAEQEIIFCEHPHVYTLGKNGNAYNMLITDDFLKQINASFYKIDRGGDITYHGPEQQVGYPILDLECLHLSLKDYIYHLEEVIIKLLADYNIKSERLQGATGVWIDSDKPSARKICAMGVRASRFVTMHGFALNVNTNLNYYNYINPCGFSDKGVTSIQKELSRKIELSEISNNLQEKFEKVFGL